MYPFQMVLRAVFGANIGAGFWAKKILLNGHPGADAVALARQPRGRQRRRQVVDTHAGEKREHI